ncbi:MAG: hypothetical protein LBC68_13300 [Prevotellaceae bacterium]|jgi:hypothetical protein|nr:hypothetical protein [Prevotellaceae bacterium]
MKPKIFTAILLFISAYSPLFLILVIKDFDFVCTYKFKHPLADYIILGISVLSVVLLFATVKLMKRGNMPVTVTEIKNRSVDLINYTIPYIVSFFGFDLSKIEDIFSLTIFLILLLLLTIKSKSIFMNPILLIAGYNLYDLEYKFDGKKRETIALSKYEMKNGERLYIRSLTRFIYFVTEKEDIQDE